MLPPPTVLGYNMSMIVLDTETTGVDFRKHGLISIGAVDFDNPENEFYGECRLRDGAHIDKAALEINGFTEEHIKEPTAQTEMELLSKFAAWTKTVGDTTFAGENPSFDRDFLKFAAERNGMDWPFAYRTIDVHAVAYAHMLKKGIEPPQKNGHSGLSTDAVLAYTGLPPRKGHHDALGDALLEAEALSRLIYGEGRIADFERYPVPDHLKI